MRYLRQREAFRLVARTILGSVADHEQRGHLAENLIADVRAIVKPSERFAISTAAALVEAAPQEPVVEKIRRTRNRKRARRR